MPKYTKVSIILKDAPNHTEYNKRIIEYLNDRHMAINDNMFTITIDVADDTNINNFVLEGVESVPAMKMCKDESYIYGVNSILSSLAKLEIDDNHNNARKDQEQKNHFQSKPTNNDTSGVNSFYEMAMKEMKSDDQEDPDTPSSLKGFKQDFSETPLTDKMIESKSRAYDKYYEERKQRNKPGSKSKQPTLSAQPLKHNNQSRGLDVDKFIQKGGYDKGEEMLMRQIAENL